MRRLALLLVAGLSACATQPPPASAPGSAAATEVAPKAEQRAVHAALHGATTAASAKPAAKAAPVMCRIGPDGGPVTAERGIGGTGGPAVRLADRGIGGTGIGGTGIVGTGIVGVITGFGSVCVDGVEVPYDAASAVDIDGTPASTADLRVGEVVAILARSQPGSAMARTISVRHDLAGRIEAVALDTGIVTVAGQPVVIGAGTEAADRFGLGDWVAVSGLRRADGVLVASRLDSGTPGQLRVHGQVVRQNDALQVGNLVLPASASAAPGQYVTLTGESADGRDSVTDVAADPLAADPAAYFGPSVSHLLVQGFVRFTGGTVSLNGLVVHAGPGVRGAREGLAIVSLERGADGKLAVVGVHYVEQPALPRHGASGGAASTPPAVALPHAPTAMPLPSTTGAATAGASIVTGSAAGAASAVISGPGGTPVEPVSAPILVTPTVPPVPVSPPTLPVAGVPNNGTPAGSGGAAPPVTPANGISINPPAISWSNTGHLSPTVLASGQMTAARATGNAGTSVSLPVTVLTSVATTQPPVASTSGIQVSFAGARRATTVISTGLHKSK